jgi:hypothetical protein
MVRIASDVRTRTSRGLRRLTCSSTTLFCKVPVRFDSLDFFEMVRLIALRAPFAKMFLLVLPGVAQPKNQSVERLWTVPVTTRVAATTMMARPAPSRSSPAVAGPCRQCAHYAHKFAIKKLAANQNGYLESILAFLSALKRLILARGDTTHAHVSGMLPSAFEGPNLAWRSCKWCTSGNSDRERNDE